MNTKRWDELARIYEEAVALRPGARCAFLDQACRGQPILRQELDSLLAHADKGEAFFDSLVEAVPAPTREVSALPAPPDFSGATFAHYRVLEQLGRGGMGVVYKARDTKLDRFVALKFLPPHLSADPQANKRFVREAKAASALDHKNICTIHDIGETDDGRLFIAMAYYPGETLKTKIERGPLAVDEALDVALQIAEGLERAHEKGIIHRDVKPANVMITDRGRVKMLDFGLAKLGSGADLTKTGNTMGTVAYMSPEQAQGEGVDHRTDLWSLGVVLYEMLTGERPFKGDNQSAIIYSILHKEPEPVTTLHPNVPEALEQIVLKLLRKDVAQRYQHMAEVLSDLKARRAPAHPAAFPISKRIPSRWRWWSAAAVLVILAMLAGALFFNQAPDTVVFKAGQITQVTHAPGLELDPALSPDGSMVAYAAGHIGQTHLYVRQLAGGRSVPLTEGFPGRHRWPRWSPDGSRISFQSQRSVYTVLPLGSNPKRLIKPQHAENRIRSHAGVESLAWSPDGRHVAYVEENVIYVKALDEAEPQALVTTHEPHALSWSPDGSRLAYVSGNVDYLFGYPILGNAAPSAIWVASMQGGDPIQITQDEYMDMSPVWTPDGRHLLFLSNRDGNMDVHYVALTASGAPAGPPVRLTTGLDAHTIYLSSDGTQLAYSDFASRANIWSIQIPHEGSVSISEAQSVTEGTQAIEGISVSPDGQWLVFDSNLNGNQDLFKMLVAGGEPEQLTTHPADDFAPSWSPDGREIAFHSFRNGNRDIYLVSADGESLRQLTDDPAQERFPDWSPDGRQLVFSSDRTGREELYVITREDQDGAWGPPRQVTVEGGFMPRWSSQDNLIAYYHGAQRGVFLISSEGGDARMLAQSQDLTTEPIPTYPEWSPDGQTVYYTAFLGSDASIWSVPVSGGAPTLLVAFDDPSRATSRFEFTNDGEHFYFTLAENESDIWLMDVLTEE